MHLTRYHMFNRIKHCFDYSIKGHILGISGISNFYPLIDTNVSKVIEVEYPAVDMRNLPFDSESFDYVITDQVIEHIDDFWKAIHESKRVLKKGGIVIHTTCFINYFHPTPLDYWRFSPDALRFLFKDFSEIIQCDGWGNRLALILCFLSDRFRYINIPDSKWSLLHLIATWNEKNYPISTWIIAKK
jgi:SAM-dependent methyltransferase